MNDSKIILPRVLHINLTNKYMKIRSIKHLLETIRKGHTTFNLHVDGMTVPVNKKTITYNQRTGFCINHHLAKEQRNVKVSQLYNTNITQIGQSIKEGRLTTIKE